MFKYTILFLTFLIFGNSCSTSKTAVAQKLNELNLSDEDIFNITAEPKDFPLILRRTTLIVRDIDQSLRLYRDAMGMEVIYDNFLTRPRKDGKEGTQTLRLVFLKATQEYVGVLGLLEYYYGEDIEKRAVRKEGFTAQNIVLLFNSHDVKEKFEMITAVPNVEVIQAPKLVEYPSYDGKSKIRVLASTFYDPDGFIVEYNELLDGL